MKLSIIVPVFNVEKYIESFFYSIVFQLRKDIELIFVNDGSTDSSIKKLEQSVRLFPHLKDNIYVFNQENQGQSEARNFGLKKSKGEYIAFLDSDDLVEENYIKEIVEHLNNKPDVLSFEALAFDDLTNKFLWSVNSSLDAGIYISDSIFLSKVFKECSWQPWLRVVKRELLVVRPFPKNKLLEDVYVFSDIYLSVKKIQHLNLSLVRYRQRNNSSIRIIDQRLIEGYNQAIVFLRKSKDSYPFVESSVFKLQQSYYGHILAKKGLINTIMILFNGNALFFNKIKIFIILLNIYFKGLLNVNS